MAAAAPSVAAALRAKRAALILQFMVVSFLSVRVCVACYGLESWCAGYSPLGVFLLLATPDGWPGRRAPAITSPLPRASIDRPNPATAPMAASPRSKPVVETRDDLCRRLGCGGRSGVRGQVGARHPRGRVADAQRTATMTVARCLRGLTV